MDPSNQVAFALACVVISVVPGPDMMFILANGITKSDKWAPRASGF
jgi:threonine/homoserine/homoserine lactone efflux protein